MKQGQNQRRTPVDEPVTKYCFACGQLLDARAEICPKCGVRQLGWPGAPYPPEDPALREAAGKKLAAGLCAILLGALGVHKFILGMTKPGVIMLLISVATCGIGWLPMHVIGIVEGIIYLTKSDEEFYQTYIVEQKGWF
jgi:TM2 domain-containing membrane protein YozV